MVALSVGVSEEELASHSEAESPARSSARTSSRDRLSHSSTRQKTRCSSAMTASRVYFWRPSHPCACGGALIRRPTVSTMRSMRACASPSASTGNCAPISSTVSARCLADARRRLGDALSAGMRRAARSARHEVRVAV